MKHFILFTLSIFLFSCGNQHIRFSKTKSNTHVVVASDQLENESAEIITTETVDVSVPASQERVNATVPIETDLSEEIATHTITSDDIPNDSISPKPLVSDKEKLAQAITAERNSTKGLVWLIASFFGFLVILLPGLIFFFIGVSRYLQAKNAQYNTEKGVDTLRIARVFLIIDTVLILLFTIIIVAFLLSLI